MSMYICSYRIDGAPYVAFINTRAEMKNVYLRLKERKDVDNIDVLIRTVTVDFGDGRLYTYLANENYRVGTVLTVPTRYGKKKAVVRSSNLEYKVSLIEKAEANGFSFSDYKVAD